METTQDTQALVLADRAGVIRYWSAGAQRRFGHAIEQTIGKTLDVVVPLEFRDAHWKGFHRAIEAGSASVEGQLISLPVVHADGSIIETPARLTLLRHPHGDVVGAIVVFADDPRE